MKVEINLVLKRMLHQGITGTKILIFSPSATNNEEIICYICGEKCDDLEHVATSGPGGIKVIQYFSCKTFVNKTPSERLALLKDKNLCFQCLLPGAKANEGKHKEGKCQRDFTCKHLSHQKYHSKKHVLVCDEHKLSNDNLDLLEVYKQRCISKNSKLPSFSREIKLSFYSDVYHAGEKSVSEDNDDVEDTGVYLLQRIKIDDQQFNVFYDNGCGDLIIKYDAAKRLKEYATQIYDGKVECGGVGDTQTHSNHGIYSLKLPLHNGQLATMSGICLDQITATFPTYPLSKVEEDIHAAFKSTGGDVSKLPKLPESVGGQVDIMIGVK